MKKFKINEIVFCGKCDDEVECEIVKKKRNITVKDTTFECEEYVPICKKCGEEIWLWEVEKENDKIVYNKYKQEIGLLSSEEIKEIRKKRHLSQRQLANLLCIGEKDITRYENGGIQTRAIDQMIRVVADDELYKKFCKLHEERNKDKPHLKLQTNS